MLSVAGDADVALTTRIHSGWFKFRSLTAFLADNDVSLLMRGKTYNTCVWSCVLHGSETWSLKRENELALHRAEVRIIRRMCGVNLTDKLSCIELRQRLGTRHSKGGREK